MPGLLDIAPATQYVAGVAVTGLSLRGLAQLIAEFPAFKAMLMERSVDITRIIGEMPDATAALIAAGIGFQGDPKQIEAAEILPFGLQVEFVAAIYEATFPNGLGVVTGHLQNLVAALPDAAPDPTAPATN